MQRLESHLHTPLSPELGQYGDMSEALSPTKTPKVGFVSLGCP